MRPKTLMIVAALICAAILPCVAIALVAAGAVTAGAAGYVISGLATLPLLGMIGSGHLVKDLSLSVTKALPNGAATTATDAIDLGVGTNGVYLNMPELLIEAPALTTGEQPNAKTLTYAVFHDTDPAFGTETSLYGTVLTQTGADGAGAAAATKRVAFPSDVKRYVRVKATGSAAGDSSPKSFKTSLMV